MASWLNFLLCIFAIFVGENSVWALDRDSIKHFAKELCTVHPSTDLARQIIKEKTLLDTACPDCTTKTLLAILSKILG